jgi:hypothetical protein
MGSELTSSEESPWVFLYESQQWHAACDEVLRTQPKCAWDGCAEAASAAYHRFKPFLLWQMHQDRDRFLEAAVQPERILAFCARHYAAQVNYTRRTLGP